MQVRRSLGVLALEISELPQVLLYTQNLVTKPVHVQVVLDEVGKALDRPHPPPQRFVIQDVIS